MNITLRNPKRDYWESDCFLTLPASWFKQQAAIRMLQLEEADPYRIEVDGCWLFQLNGMVISGENGISEKLIQLNNFARKLQGMLTSDRDIYVQILGNHCKELEESDDVIAECSRLADTISSYTVYEGICNDESLGEVCLDNEWLGSTEGISKEMLECLSRAKIGEKYRKSVDGFYTRVGFCIPDKSEVELSQAETSAVSNRNLLDEKSDGTLRIIMRTMDGEKEKDICWTLPDSENKYRGLELVRYRSYGKAEAGVYDVLECDCIIPQLNMMLKKEGDFEQWNKFAGCLKQLKDAGQLSKYITLISMMASENVDEALAVAEKMDSYEYYQDICSAESYARFVLKKAGLDIEDLLSAKMRPGKYGEILMKKERMHCCSYGTIKLKGDQEMLLNESPSVSENSQNVMKLNI